MNFFQKWIFTVLIVLVAVNGAVAQARHKIANAPGDFRLFFGYTGPTQEVFRIDTDGKIHVTVYYGLPLVPDISSLLRLKNTMPSSTPSKRLLERKSRLKNRLSKQQIRAIFSELQRSDFLNPQNYWLEGCRQESITSESKTLSMWFRADGQTLSGSVFEKCDPTPGTKAARFFEVYEMLRGLIAGVETIPVKSLDELSR